MIDLNRYKGLLVTGAGLLCAFILLNAVLLAAFGQAPSIFNNPDRQLAWTQLEDTGARIAGIEQQFRHNPSLADQPFGIILGQSTTLRGIDPDALEHDVTPHERWLLLNGFGSSFVKLHYYAKALIASKLKPDIIVLGLHPTMLAGQNPNVSPDSNESEQVNDNPTDDDWHPKRWVMQLIWVRTQRKNISQYTNMFLYEQRLALHGWLGSGAVGLFKPAADPWNTPPRDPLPEHLPAKFLRLQDRSWRGFGWYEPGSYTTTNQHAKAFRDLITGLESLGPRQIIIVNMPISSGLRSRLPNQAQTVFNKLIDEVSIGRPIRVIDMRDTMDDKYFADYAHLNPAGREVFSRLLAERINALNTHE